MSQSLLEWILAVVGSGGIGAIITYIFTFKSKQKLARVEADSAEIDMEQKKNELYHDQYQYLQELCDKYLKDYHELQETFKTQISDMRNQLDSILLEKSNIISHKCVEIAELKSKVTYLNGIRCYNFTCPNRVKDNPEKIVE